MKNSNYPVAAINSGCELFLRFITFAAIDTDVSFNWLRINKLLEIVVKKQYTFSVLMNVKKSC